VTTDSRTLAEAERIHHAWNDAPAARNVEATTAPCAEDATIESPLVRYLLGSDARDTRPFRAFITSTSPRNSARTPIPY
jgi:hypothetical protein